MPPALRNLFPYIACGALALAIYWATSFTTLPKADFTFCNGDQIKTVDPAIATGQPENRVINGLFEGLLSSVPDGDAARPTENVPLILTPGVAELPKVSEDGKVYTFEIRPTAKWSNGRAMNAADFVFSWQRLLHPETTSEYAYQLHYVVGGEAYNTANIAPGDAVEVELYDRQDPAQQYPRGTLERGKLQKITEPPPLTFDPDTPKDDQERLTAEWKKKFVYSVAIGGQTRHFSKDALGAKDHFENDEIEKIHHILPDFDQTVGIKAKGERTLEVTLNSPTPYFGELTAFYPLYPVCRECIEEHGTPKWTRPENIVSNGAFRLELYRMRDRIRLTKSDTYWNKQNVALNTVDALAVKGETTMLNMYLTGQVDWITTVPNTAIPELKLRDDFYCAPMLTVYFYRVNVDRPPLNNVLVRRALNLAIDKQAIVDRITKAGQIPARSFVPPGLAGYESSLCGEYNVAEARRLLAEAGFPNGQGMPKVEILFNTSDDHRTIAEFIQQQWSAIGVQCELRNLEWGSFLDTLSNKQYMTSRSGWIGDYPDPNTFLDMFVTGGANNQTNWSNKDYDQLIKDAKVASGAERLAILTRAERILMDELPILPIYFQVSKNLVNPRVKGFNSTIQDIHPLELLRVE